MFSAIVSLHHVLQQQKKYETKPDNILEKETKKQQIESRKASADVVVEESLTNMMS